MKEKKEYSWIDDPFIEKEQEHKGMRVSSKMLLGCGCLVLLIVLVIFFIMLFASLSGMLSA